MQVRNLVEGHWNFEQTRRALCPPWGLWGGTPGEPGSYLLRLPEETEFRELAGARLPVPVGASAIVRTGGGGGWGDPCEREPALVIDDVREEFISRKSARDLYGVVIGDDFTLDAASTEALRKQKRALPARKGAPTAKAR
jgi:N-methylhydantoinase B